MRFFLNRKTRKGYNQYSPVLQAKHSDDGSDGYGSDYSNDRRNGHKFRLSEREIEELIRGTRGEEGLPEERGPEYEGNENTPINRLPNEILSYIFELRMLEYCRTDESASPSGSWDSSTFRDDLMHHDRTILLNEIGLVCREWHSVAGQICCREVIVDGFPEDFDRAIDVFGGRYPGVTSLKGASVLNLRVILSADRMLDPSSSYEKAVKLLQLCPNLIRLSFRCDEQMTASEMQDLFEEGIKGRNQSLQVFAWSVNRADSITSNIVRYLGDLSQLTELNLKEEDALYTCEALTLPRLKRYRIEALQSSILRHQSKWVLSSLVDLCLCIRWGGWKESVFDVEAVLLFIRSHGLGLRHLKLEEFRKSYDLLDNILDASPNLLQLELDINMILFETRSNYLRHDKLNILKITGATLKKGENRAMTMGAYMARFVNTIRECNAFPNLIEIKMKEMRGLFWGDGLDDSDRDAWEKWFAMETNRRPVITDEFSNTITYKDITSLYSASFRLRR